jgi:predicted nucleic acid-binding protein
MNLLFVDTSAWAAIADVNEVRKTAMLKLLDSIAS